MPGTMPTGFILLLIAFYQGRFFAPFLFFGMPYAVSLALVGTFNAGIYTTELASVAGVLNLIGFAGLAYCAFVPKD